MSFRPPWRKKNQRHDYGPWLEQVAEPEEKGRDFESVLESLLAELPDELALIVRMKLQGLSHPQIARRLGCAPATVERRLRAVRRYWIREAHS